MPTLAVATCSELPGLDEEGRLLLAEFDRLGVQAVPVVWDDPGVCWKRFSRVVIRATWDYYLRPGQFLEWSRSVGDRLVNRLPLVEWNIDKATYLRDLAADGVAVIPAVYVAPGGDTSDLPSGRVVVKPTIAAGSWESATHLDRVAAASHISRLHELGRVAMIQPYLPEVETVGEIDVVFIAGRYSHSVRKYLTQETVLGLWRQERIESYTPDSGALAAAHVAHEAIAARHGIPAYARIDLLQAGDGSWLVLEAELMEPALWLEYGPGSARLLAAALCSDVARM
jgi:hypothetical protein